MAVPDVANAESWFLARGLPYVLTLRARRRRLWQRSAPVLVGLAVLTVCALAVYLLTGDRLVNVEGDPSTVEWIALGIVGAALPLAAAAAAIVISTVPRGYRGAASAAACSVMLVANVIGGTAESVAVTAAVIGSVLALTATGVGSIVGWSVRLMTSHLSAVGALLIRALPVLLLTVLVFFNSPVWIMAATVTRTRLWLALLLLAAIAGSFVVSGTLARARPILNAPGAHRDAAQLADSPFAAMPDPSIAPPLNRTERLNVFFVLVVSQLVQIMTVAVVIAAIFFLLGLILLSPELLAAWTRGGAGDGTLLGMVIPVPQALIQITLFLGALTFMYIGARAVGDGEYRSDFLDPLLDDLRLMLVARNRYRHRVTSSQ